MSNSVLIIDHSGVLSVAERAAAFFAAVRYMKDSLSGVRVFETGGVKGTIRHVGRFSLGEYRGERFVFEFDSFRGAEDSWLEGFLPDYHLNADVPKRAVVFRLPRKRGGHSLN